MNKGQDSYDFSHWEGPPRSIPGKGFRSEPMVERRIELIQQKIEQSPETLPGPDDKQKWGSDFDFIFMTAPQLLGKFLRATLESRLDADNYITKKNDLLSNRWSSFHSAPDAVNVILDMARKLLPEKRYLSQVENTALFCIKDVLGDRENRNPNLWHTIDMLIKHYDIAQTGHSFVKLSFFHTVIMSYEEEISTGQLRERINKLISMGQQAGGDINEFSRHDEVEGSALIMAAHLYDNGLGGDVGLSALLDCGADWEKALGKVGHKSRKIIERHPRVTSEKLIRIAKTKSEFRNKTEATGRSLKM